MAKKYYAVKKGRKIGIFETWDECKAQVMGYPSASYKSFTEKIDAENFLIDEEVTEKKLETMETDDENINIIRAYVDGSYNNDIGKYSCGVVILYKDKKWTLSEMGENDELASMRNVAGELLGAIRAMEWAAQSDIENPVLVIYHDYEGISKWATKSWKANKEGTRDYIKIFDKHIAKFDIKFIKVKAHTGDKYNEEADQLAKDAIFGEIAIEKESKFEPEEINKKYKELLELAIDRYSAKEDSSTMIVPIGEYELTEKIVKEFAKIVWKKEGFLLKVFKQSSLKILVQEEIIRGTINGKNGEQLDIELELKRDDCK